MIAAMRARVMRRETCMLKKCRMGAVLCWCSHVMVLAVVALPVVATIFTVFLHHPTNLGKMAATYF
jgi:hypothetical protein